ncbi:carboxylesterase/lipase family protein [Mucilaginibacter sp. AK015]|uniref:carboxylesterase/lipase family protein n=1 Tax=Mucilaginibacter sp. AK015 TaxID=2723072 RepID=UPI0016127A99|nr:carboxylesterase family protein [Mucilaginibacter sp. AK015]MBB5394201.1 para-nitrobenzyl esterase [Mucilaginibacter sp. AK015]
MKRISFLLLLQFAFTGLIAQTGKQIKIADGIVEGVTEKSGVISFKGIPFAQPPIGELRWREPQPVNSWTGVRKCDAFGYNAMQKQVFGDMGFRTPGMSEDCLYLNVWMPAKRSKTKLPVLVYFYGGGFVCGDGSERRYDGESMAKRGIITLTVNYRLGVFGFMSHPELTKESVHHASGNYGLLDQAAALRWVRQNIAAFGGDPKRVTIAGESAGSIAVSAQMVSPLSKNMFAGAIGESGAMINPTLPAISLAEGEKNGVKFGEKIGATTLEALRAIPADKLLDDASMPGTPPMSPTVDGYFLLKKPVESFLAGEQAKVPLLAGWNSAEIPYQALMYGNAPTPENYAKQVKMLYGEKADKVLKLYPGTTQTEVIKSATELASDRFISYSTWKWADAHALTSGKPVYRYLFSKPLPPMTAKMANAKAGLAGGVIKGDAAKPETKKGPQPYAGAAHASEIEYAMGNLATNTNYAWTPADYQVSATMEGYFANFIKTGNPNDGVLPKWNANVKDSPVTFMNIDVKTVLEKESTQLRNRYLFLDTEYMKK